MSSFVTDMHQMTFSDINPEYEAFVNKFKLKPKKTTDECYTPDNVYEAVAEWVSAEYGVRREDMVRPFFPGGDYVRHEYPDGCTVVDNPPFSILSRIVKFYNAEGVRYFMFAPELTNFQTRDCSHVIAGCSITYENGARVRTSFVTNIDAECKVRTAPALHLAVKEANDANLGVAKKVLPKYSYPDHVLTAAKVGYMAAHGVDYRLRFGDGYGRISALDAKRAVGKSIFGDGYLLSERAAAERAAAERAAAERAAAERAAAERAAAEHWERWELSEREWKMVEMLGGGRR